MKEKYEIRDVGEFEEVLSFIYEQITGGEDIYNDVDKNPGLSFLFYMLRNVSLDEKIDALKYLIRVYDLDYELNPNYFIEFDKDDEAYDPRYDSDDFDLIDYVLRKYYDDEIELEDLEVED